MGRFMPERRFSADRLKAALRDHPPDPGFADDMASVRTELRAAFSDEVRQWADE